MVSKLYDFSSVLQKIEETQIFYRCETSVQFLFVPCATEQIQFLNWFKKEKGWFKKKTRFKIRILI